jgi:L-aminopeptidase/D-esterase-like protein
VIATDAPVSKAQAQRLAIMAQDGLARCIRPIHTQFDGDTLFALSTAREGLAPVDPLTLSVLGTLAADCVVRAVRRAVGIGPF